MATLKEQIKAVKPGQSFMYDDGAPGDLTITRSEDGKTATVVFGNEWSDVPPSTEDWEQYTDPNAGVAAFTEAMLGNPTPFNVVIIENKEV